MRYCKKTKEIIKSSYKSATVNEIQQLIYFAGLRRRSKKSIKSYVDDLIDQDVKREKRRKKLEEWALANPIKYRARTLVAGAKARAKARGNDFDLDAYWVEAKLREGMCEITGTPFFIKPYSIRSEYKRVHPHSPDPPGQSAPAFLWDNPAPPPRLRSPAGGQSWTTGARVLRYRRT